MTDAQVAPMVRFICSNQGPKYKSMREVPAAKRWSQSELRRRRNCPAAGIYAYDMLRKQKADDSAHALYFGTFIHRATDLWMRTKEIVTVLKWIEAQLPHLRKESDMRMARAMMTGYCVLWKSAKVQSVANGSRFCVPFPETTWAGRNGHYLCGEWDGVVRWNGTTYMRETKTSSEDISMGSAYYTSLRMDSQTQLYYGAAEAMGYELEGVMYDVLGKPANKVPVSGDLDAYEKAMLKSLQNSIEGKTKRKYMRYDILITPEQVEAAWEDASETIRARVEYGLDYRNDGACRKWGRLCEYFDVCTGMADINDNNRFQTKEAKHEELA